ncbi:MAG: hypothetical protein PHQ77_06130 [Proteiniphilum sp.]|jgi:hypothetical protein|nr:hypothetical protein [Proteiniphilum sp.]
MDVKANVVATHFLSGAREYRISWLNLAITAFLQRFLLITGKYWL